MASRAPSPFRLLIGSLAERLTGSGHAPSAARAARSAARRPLRSPRPVTTGGKSRQGAIVDWLNCTFEHRFGLDELCETLSQLLGGRHVAAEPMTGGRFGFEHGVKLLVWANACLSPFAEFSWGGVQQRGRALLSISGGGCRLVESWEDFASWLQVLPAVRITRLDLAVDCHEGEYTVDDCASWAMEGRFTSNGRPPSFDTQGDWLSGEHGRTLYIGKAQNGKMLRCYEKGKALGDLSSPWVRYEVQLGSRDREIPVRALVDRDEFFAGAYPALEELLAVAGERIATVRHTTRATVERAVLHLRRTYGAWINLLSSSGIESADLVEAVRIRAVPSRMQAASLADAGLAATVQAAFKQRGSSHAIQSD